MDYGLSKRAIDGVCTLPLSPQKGGSKSDFCFIFEIKFNFNQIKSATKFLCVKTSSGKVEYNHSPI